MALLGAAVPLAQQMAERNSRLPRSKRPAKEPLEILLVLVLGEVALAAVARAVRRDEVPVEVGSYEREIARRVRAQGLRSSIMSRWHRPNNVENNERVPLTCIDSSQRYPYPD